MTWKILILLFTFALAAMAGTAQACGGTNFIAPVSGVLAAANNPVLPPLIRQAIYRHHGPGKIRRTALNLAASSIKSWTDKFKTFLDTRMLEKSCLATAVYFEARSESQLGQLAVATVILNRVKASNYSSSICGVVYKGASRLNACQFSFACDGKPDLPDDRRAWQTALAVTAIALADDQEMEHEQMRIVASATHYHADNVEPNWSKSFYRLTKIGRHIFYSQG